MILEPRYDSRKSFYGKAIVEVQENGYEQTKDLYSYGTRVASVVHNFEKNIKTYSYYGKYSQTTSRHQKEFFKQEGLTDKEIKELIKNGTLYDLPF